jgi:hypothetical protein
MSTLTPNPPVTPDGVPGGGENVPSHAAPHRSRRLWLVLGVVLACVLAAGAFVLLQGGGEPSLTNTHAAEAGEPALASVPGYAYENPTGDYASLSQSLEQSITTANDQTAAMLPKGTGDFYQSSSGHQVMSGADQPDALLFLATVNPAVESMSGFDPGNLVTGMAGGMATAGGTVTTETIAGEDVVVAEGGGDVAYAWYHDGTVSMAIGHDKSTVRDFAEAYLTQVHG